MTFLREVGLTLSFGVVAAGSALLLFRIFGLETRFGRAALGVWVVIEIAFFALQRLRYHRLNRRNEQRPSAQDVDERFRHFLTLAPVVDIRDFISGWFLNIPFSEIRAGNVADFIAYAYWYQPRSELAPEEQARVLEYTRAMEDAWGVRFPEGSNDSLHLMGHLWEPLKVVHKPLLVHLASESSICVTHLALQAMKFQRYECMGFTYWARGLQPPRLAPGEDAGRLSLLQSVAQDLGSLVRGDAAVGAGPIDALALLSSRHAQFSPYLVAKTHARMQLFTEYQQRLRGALASLTPPNLPDLAGRLPSFPHGLPRLAVPSALPPFLAALPRLPSVSALSGMPAFRDLGSMDGFGDLRLPKSEAGAAAAAAVVGRLPTLEGMSRMPPFRDLTEPGGFDDLQGSLGLAGMGGPGAGALPESIRASAAAARARLTGMLPVLNLPDWCWRADAEGGGGHSGDRGPTWQERLRCTSNAMLDDDELNDLLARMPAMTDRGLREESDGVNDEPHTAADIVQAWLASAKGRLWGGVPALFCGIALPSPAHLLGRFARDTSEDVARRAAALRQAIEGSVLRSGNLEAFCDSGSECATPRSRGTAESGGTHTRSPAESPGGVGRYNLRHTPAREEARHRHSTPSIHTPAQRASQQGSPLPSSAPRSTAHGAPGGPGTCQADATSAGAAGVWPSGQGGAGAADSPLVFMHGVGFGVFPYLGFVSKLLRAFKGRPFVLLEVRHVSLRLCMRAAGVDDVVRVLAALLRRHGVQHGVFAGHSFGTLVVAHMRKIYPEMVKAVLLCDPVCMLTCFPKLLYNFIYRDLTLRDVIDNPAEAARWFAARDLVIAATFCRHFWWHTLMLWPWELPDPSVLVLSGRDTLVPSELVSKQLRDAPAHVHVLERPKLHHGHFLFHPRWQDEIVAKFKEVVEAKEAEGGV